MCRCRLAVYAIDFRHKRLACPPLVASLELTDEKDEEVTQDPLPDIDWPEHQLVPAHTEERIDTHSDAHR